MPTPATPPHPHGSADAPPPPLAGDELLRYSRHLRLPEVGPEGQRRLAAARVLIIGMGGLGSPAALYLAAAGVGRIGIIDADRVDLSNLQRQVLHDTASVGSPKVDSARRRLAALNPHVRVDVHEAELSRANALDIIDAHDVVVDGSDNFRTRYLTSDACVLLGKPNVYGSVSRFEGQASVFATATAPCYRCLFPVPPAAGSVPSCDVAGVLGVLPGLVGMIQATEALKLILGIGETLEGRLLLVDALRMRFHAVRLARDPACPACGSRTLTELDDYDALCGAGPEPDDAGGRSAAPNEPAERGVRDITPAELDAWIRSDSPPTLIDVREGYEWTIARIPGARLIPLGEVEHAAPTIDRSRDVVLYCHHGMRSLAAARRLEALGFARLWNLTGGIARWSRDVDPAVPQY